MKKEPMVLLGLDMDDNMCDTNAYINQTLISYFERCGFPERVKQVKELSLKMSTFEYPDDLRDLIWTLAIEPGSFMKYATPTDLVTGSFFSKLRALHHQSKGRLLTVICTHRGFHDDAVQNTKFWLESHGPHGLITNVHAIKSKDHPNKLDFLQEMYPEFTIRLLDDNPFHDKDTIHPKDDRVVIYDQINRFEAYKNQDFYRGPSAMINNLARALELY